MRYTTYSRMNINRHPTVFRRTFLRQITSRRIIPRRPSFFLRRALPAIRVIIITISVVLLLSGLYVLVFKSGSFRVSRVNVFGTQSFVNGVDLTEVVRGKVYGNSIFKVNTPELEYNLLQNFQGAKSISVYKVYPTSINVDVKERTPLALVYNDGQPDFYMVDEDGYVLGLVESDKTNLPKIKYEGDIKVGLFVASEMIPVYMELVDSISEHNLKVSSMSFYPNYAQLYTEGGIEVYIGNDKSKSESVTIIADLVKQLGLEDRKVKKIDLRYDKVIVSYE